MIKKWRFIKTFQRHNIYYEPKFFQQYIVLYPKENGYKEMHRFDTVEEAEDDIARREIPIMEPERYLA